MYTGAVCDNATPMGAVININGLADRAAFTRPTVSVDDDRETPNDRRARRTATWTPATLQR